MTSVGPDIIGFSRTINKECVSYLLMIVFSSLVFHIHLLYIFLGYVWSPIVEVNMFSSKSVNDSIENVLLSLCHGGIPPDQIDIDSVDVKCKEEMPLPDPCLVVVFGKTFSSFGFMPWQLRATELS